MKGLIIATIYIVVIILLIVIFIIKNIKEAKRLKEAIRELETEKNLILSAPILNELSKVESLVKDDKTKSKYDNWQNRFDSIRNKDIPEVTDMILTADGYVEDKNYKDLRVLLANIELRIYRLRERTEKLLNEIKEITLSEEKNRERIVKLKSEYRVIKSDFEKDTDAYGNVKEAIDLQFETIEKRFQEFEIAMEKKDYDDINYIVKSIDEMVEHMKYVIKEVPAILIMCNELIPNKISDISDIYIKMTRDNYQLDYLNVDYNIEETNKKISDILDRIKVLNLEDVVFELKTIINYFDSLYNDFEGEKIARTKFEENVDSFKFKLGRTDKVLSSLLAQINDLESNYDLSKNDIDRLNILNKEVNSIKTSFNDLNECNNNHSFPYSRLSKELDFLIIKLSKIDESLEYDVQTIGNMKEDEARAREQLDSIKDLIKKARNRIRLCNIPVVPDNYFVELKDASDAIKEINKELNKKPINIETLNIRVDTARDLAFKIFNTTNDLIKNVMMAEETIIYGNRYRPIKEQVNIGLDKAEVLFNEGSYKKALEVAMNAIDYVEPEIHNKILKAFNEEGS
ncbi:MAG: septation ring formation regulator EzrA [Bacilli bacterium]|nr:septation ring formation regulator EzrA [Bacilli bacterium]